MDASRILDGFSVPGDPVLVPDAVLKIRPQKGRSLLLRSGRTGSPERTTFHGGAAGDDRSHDPARTTSIRGARFHDRQGPTNAASAAKCTPPRAAAAGEGFT